MVWEARRTHVPHQSAERLPLRIGTANLPEGLSSHWQLHPRSRPREDGTRRITIEALSDGETLIIDLTAGDAVGLMFELGAALEQAARDERRGSHDSRRLEAISRDRA